MTTVNSDVERRIVVPGRAVSFRSPRARAYKDVVASLARAVFETPSRNGELEIFLDYFHASKRKMDIDNIAKAVLDALNTIAYVDDQQIRNVIARAFCTSDLLYIAGGPADLIKPLRDHQEYLLIRLREPSWKLGADRA